MEEAEIATINNEPRRASIGLNHVAKLWMGVFEAGRRMRIDCIGEQFVEVAGLEFGMAGGVNLSGKLEDFRHIFTGNRACQNDWRVWNKVEVIFEIIEDFVAVFVLEVSLRNDENDALSGVDDLAGEGLVELGMRLGAIDEEAANVGFFDGGEAAEGAKLFDANFAFAWLAETSSIKQFDRATLVANFGTVNIAGSTGEICNHSLLLFGKRVKEAGFANVWTANESDFYAIVWLFFPLARIETEVFEFGENLAAEFIKTDAGRRGNADWILGAEHEEFFVWK